MTGSNPLIAAADELADAVNSWLSMDTLKAPHGEDGNIADRLATYFAARHTTPTKETE